MSDKSMATSWNRRHDEDHGCLSLTPHLVRDAVEQLEKLRARVSLQLMAEHFQRNMPVTRDTKALIEELRVEADKAVKRGWLRKFADGAYSLSNLKWQASVDEYGYDNL
ncbi:uncharacterized protein LOC111694427 [Trichogramma pretiosum]|uniref:Uncharacterized protein n=1 Tax=Trichogramma kaykai TaxID=54128 RepID=A0ABD2WLI8_9HYME|nr:uncharacterized protein LOC111694427 [Trichogramma pretiosum]